MKNIEIKKPRRIESPWWTDNKAAAQAKFCSVRPQSLRDANA